MKTARYSILLTSLLGVVAVANAQQQQPSQQEIQACMEKLKRESAAKGFPITDPHALRYQCIEMLKQGK